MECTGFLGGDLRTASIIISVLGIVHPVWWALASRRFRSEWFITLYVLTGAWCLVSCLLLAGVFAEVVMLYWIWIWFSLIFVAVMIIGMIVMFVGFCVLRMRIVALCPALGLLYYILVIYCICVVNTQRRDVLRARAPSASHAARAGPAPAAAAPRAAGTMTRALRDVSLETTPITLVTHTTGLLTPASALLTTASALLTPASALLTPASAVRTTATAPLTTTTALLTPTKKSPRRGLCSVPPRNPDNGVYMAALPSNKLAKPGRGYRRLRLWVYCDKYYKPRHLQYAFCYSGGWNLPLPDCVKDASYYETYYVDFPVTTTKKVKRGVCEVPSPPEHGYFLPDAKLTKRYMQLGVGCNALHFLVGRQRITCRHGVWDRPVPSCMFMDTTVCTLLEGDRDMVRTCLASGDYAGTYRCDAGVVPHGAVVEPRCRRHHYVWGPFSYLYCVNGIWHPKLLANNITCEHAVDIYRHYEIEATRKTTTTPAAPDDSEYEDYNAKVKNNTTNQTQLGGRRSGQELSKTKLNKRTRRSSSSSRTAQVTDKWKKQSKAGDLLTSTPAKVDINWLNSDENNSSKSNYNIIWKPQWKTNRLPTTGRISISRRKIDITDKWKAQTVADETLGTNSIETSIWKPPVGDILLDNSIETEKESRPGTLSDTKLTKMEKRPLQRDREWFKFDSVESQIQSTDIFEENLIKTNIKATDRLLEFLQWH